VPGFVGGVTFTMSPSIRATMSFEFGSTFVILRMPPSGSESLRSGWTDTVPPGRIRTSSDTATGLRAPCSFGLIPTRTMPVARAPRASITV